jgi:hypothetical protein
MSLLKKFIQESGGREVNNQEVLKRNQEQDQDSELKKESEPERRNDDSIGNEADS